MKLKAWTHGQEKTLPELAEDIERLVLLAYPDSTESVVEVLAKDQFVDSLPTRIYDYALDSITQPH